MSLPARIEAKIDRSGQCHLWTGARSKGYGYVKYGGRMRAIHRLVYELEVGPIPPDMTIDHVKTRGCTSGLCVRLEHLEPVSRAENIRRGGNAAKTRCPKGHEYDGVRKHRSGLQRFCTRCAREARERYAASH